MSSENFRQILQTKPVLMRDVTDVLEDEWTGLYGESWSGVIVPEAMAHPAKYSRALVRAIYIHVISCGWIKPGDSLIDPFGGVALGGLDAMTYGLNWTGCELEERFVRLGSQNLELWNERYSRMPKWGTARLVQGDSRKLGRVLTSAKIAITSPPFLDARTGTTASTETRGGGPCADRVRSVANGDLIGQTEGQLAAMREGDRNAAAADDDTFWSASRVILEQLYSLIVPGGHVVFVVKGFVRRGQIVDFPAQWTELCEAVGFRLVHHHKALLVEHSGMQSTFHGEDKHIRVERKSFFRRLAESKGSPRIDHESVLCLAR